MCGSASKSEDMKTRFIVLVAFELIVVDVASSASCTALSSVSWRPAYEASSFFRIAAPSFSSTRLTSMSTNFVTAFCSAVTTS